MANPYFVPLTVFASENVRSFSKSIKRVEKSGHSRMAFVSREFDEIQQILARDSLFENEEETAESATRYFEVPSGWPSDIDPEDYMEVPPSPAPQPSSSWTGLLSVKNQVTRVAKLAPVAMKDIERLIDETRLKRFNDQETADALSHLRDLHSALGDLLHAADAGAPLQSAFRLVHKHKAAFIQSLKQGAKVAIAAPALTLGVVHILSTISGVVADSQLIGTVYAAMVGGDALRQMGWKRRK
jgi:hypothetical protein